jgi:arsenate reductase
MKEEKTKKYILFVCIENSARSQIAEGFFNAYNTHKNIVGISAGLEPVKEIKPNAVKVMKEKGIDLSKQYPKELTPELVEQSIHIYTMGCINHCPLTPKEKTTSWSFDDPKNKDINEYRRIRDEIEKKIKEVISSL